MRKLILILGIIVLSFSLIACGETSTEEKEVDNVESSGQDDAEEVVEEESSDVEEIGEVIADDDTLKATLVSVEHKVDEMFDEESYRFNIELENKYDGKIVVQARDVSIDGTMVDDMVFFSEEIAEGKKANGQLEIQNYDGDLPEMNEELEMILIVSDDETWDEISSYDVNISF